MSSLMEKHLETFGVPRPIIGCLHMQALPGTPYADDKMTLEEQIRRLKQDARVLQDAGFDALVFANEGDRPYLTPVGRVSQMQITCELLQKLHLRYAFPLAVVY